MHLQHVTDTIKNVTGWNEANIENAGIISFELEGDITLNIHCPGGEYVFLYSTLASLPEDEYLMQEACHNLAKVTLGTCKKMRSSISISDNSIILSLDVSNVHESADIIMKAKIFLNELAWWKKQLGLLM